MTDAATDTGGAKITKEHHIRGRKGALISLDKAVKRIDQAYQHPKLRAHAMKWLEESGWTDDKLEQAQKLFAYVIAHWRWIDDPWDTEFMVHPVCMVDGSEPMCGTDGIAFMAGDCDDLLIFVLSIFLAMGIGPCYVIGHSYEANRDIGHVLGAVDTGKGTFRVDPSAKYGFGKTLTPTKERWLAIPTGAVVDERNGFCDLGRIQRIGPQLALRPQGRFVGVGRAPSGTLSGPADDEPQKMSWKPIAVGAAGAVIGALATFIFLRRESPPPPPPPTDDRTSRHF